MAAGLGFKDFVTGEVLTANDVDGYLMQGVWVFASAAARDAAVTSPQEGNFAYLKDTNVTTYYTGSVWANLDTTGMTNPMTTTGDTIYSSSGSTPARLGIGSTGNVLTVAGGVPTWAAPAGGGKVLQVVQGTRTSDTSTTSTSLVDTNLTVTITPTLATSKIMIFVSHPKVKLTRTGTSPANYGSFVLLRGATQLQESMTGSEEYTYTNGVFHNSIPFSYLDSPATTSATTYKTQFSVINANITALITGSATIVNSIVAMEIGA